VCVCVCVWCGLCVCLCVVCVVCVCVCVCVWCGVCVCVCVWCVWYVCVCVCVVCVWCGVCVCVCLLFHCLFDKEDKLFNVPFSNTVNESAVYVAPCYVSLVGDCGLSQQPRFVTDRLNSLSVCQDTKHDCCDSPQSPTKETQQGPEGFCVTEIYLTANKCTTLFSVSLFV